MHSRGTRAAVGGPFGSPQKEGRRQVPPAGGANSLLQCQLVRSVDKARVNSPHDRPLCGCARYFFKRVNYKTLGTVGETITQAGRPPKAPTHQAAPTFERGKV